MGFKCSYVAALVLAFLSFSISKRVNAQTDVVNWKINNVNKIGEYTPVVLGNPLSVKNGKGTSISFNGVNDGLIIPAIPVKGWKSFTIQVLFKPSSNGPVAPRFMHWQDKDGNRGTFEVRLTPKGEWYLDTFLKNGKLNKGLTLIDSSKLHKADKWYWAAIVYDGKHMSSYINGVKELEGDIDIPVMTDGETALGVRLNKVDWFKGSIKEISFYPGALEQSALQKQAL